MKSDFTDIYLFLILLMPYGCGTSTRISFVEHEDRIEVMAKGRPFTTYMHGSYLSKPILYPVRSPSGKIITRGYPLAEVPGESHDHPHHIGVSFTYGSNDDVNGNSFWANPHDKPPITAEVKLPQIRQIEMLEMKSNRNRGVLTVVNHWVDKNNRALLQEDRKMEFSEDHQKYTIDFYHPAHCLGHHSHIRRYQGGYVCHPRSRLAC